MDNINILNAHKNLVCAATEECFRPIAHHRSETEHIFELRKHRIQRRRIKFANSKLFEIWCDCQDMFEYNKLKNKILLFNK